MNKLLISAGAALAFLSLTAVVEAQTGVWTAPTLGYVFDIDSKSLRPISGIPGASTIEDSLAISSKLINASVAPNRRHGIGQVHGEGLTYLRLGAREAVAIPLEGGLDQVDLISWSPSSDSVAIYGNSRLQVWTGLDQTPSLSQQFDAPALTALAVSDRGRSIAGVSEVGTLVWQSELNEPILHSAHYRSLLYGSDGALLAGGDDRVVILRSGSEPETLAAEGIANAAGLALSADGRKLLVTNEDSEKLVQVDLDSRAASIVECGCRAAAPSRLQGNNVFRLTGITDKGVLVFDGDAAEPRVLAIPFAGGQQ